MKIKLVVFALSLVLFIWLVQDGYKHISFFRSLNDTSYDKNFVDRLDIASTTKNTITKIANAVSESDVSTTTKKKEVTHIKTPENVKAIYMSSWVAGSPSIRARLIKMIDDTELNAVVIDVKDNTGVITWESRMKDMDDFIEELHEKNIYVIARIAAFQDPAYVTLHPELAVKNKITGKVWKDHKGVPWIDTGSKVMWDYLLSLGNESYARGFDEINYDYIRFPTDGALSEMEFPISGVRAKTDKPGIVSDFYKYITSELHKNNIPVSGDLFGIIMVTKVDIATIGQDMHSALETFDYVAPMIYPSHFYAGTDGFQKPAEHPKEIIDYAMRAGIKIADEVASSTAQATSTIRNKYRPWYQDFDMGATYTAQMVRGQIEAGENLGIKSWMLWDPANKYTEGALKKE